MITSWTMCAGWPVVNSASPSPFQGRSCLVEKKPETTIPIQFWVQGRLKGEVILLEQLQQACGFRHLPESHHALPQTDLWACLILASPGEIVLSKFPALPKWRTPLFPCIKIINTLIYFELKSGSCFPNQTRTKPLSLSSSLRTTVLPCRLAQRSLKHPVLADLGSQLMAQWLLSPSTKVKPFLRPELLCVLSSPHHSS